MRGPLVQMVGSKRPSTVHGGRSYFGGPALGPLSGNSRYRVMRAAAAAGRLHETGASLIRRVADANFCCVLAEGIVVAAHSFIRRFMPQEVNIGGSSCPQCTSACRLLLLRNGNVICVLQTSITPRSDPLNPWQPPTQESWLHAAADGHGDGSDYVHVAPRTADERYEQRKAARLSLDTSFPGAAAAAAAARRAEDDSDSMHGSGSGPLDVRSLLRLHPHCCSCPCSRSRKCPIPHLAVA